MRACGDHVRGMSYDGLEKMVVKLDNEKAMINNWARNEIKGRMIAEARRKNLSVQGVKVKYFRDIGRAWASVQELENTESQVWRSFAKRVFYIHTGMWDVDRRWSRKMEGKFMEWKRLVYSDIVGNPARQKGIIEKLISYQKVQMVKSIMRPAIKKGLTTISVRRSQNEMVGTGQRRNMNRKPGAFDLAYIKRGKRKSTSPKWELENSDTDVDTDGRMVWFSSMLLIVFKCILIFLCLDTL
jgi:hypothetical protein